LDFRDEFQGLSSQEINQQIIGPHQNSLLRQWMGIGVRGAVAAQGLALPEGLTARSLRAYHEIARRAVFSGNDPRGTQAARLQLIESVLRNMGY
jgi:hypothetical protein